MNMNDVIVSKVDRGSFKFPIQFELFGNRQNISNAVFDTGCSHSLISANILNIGNKSLEDLEHEALMDIDVVLAIGAGVESNIKQIKELRKYVESINSLKAELRKITQTKDYIKFSLANAIKNNINKIEICRRIAYNKDRVYC